MDPSAPLPPPSQTGEYHLPLRFRTGSGMVTRYDRELFREAARMSGRKVSRWAAEVLRYEALRVILAARNKPARLRPGAAVYANAVPMPGERTSRVIPLFKATGEERVWVVGMVEHGVPDIVDPSGKAYVVDVLGARLRNAVVGMAGVWLPPEPPATIALYDRALLTRIDRDPTENPFVDEAHPSDGPDGAEDGAGGTPRRADGEGGDGAPVPDPRAGAGPVPGVAQGGGGDAAVRAAPAGEPAGRDDARGDGECGEGPDEAGASAPW